MAWIELPADDESPEMVRTVRPWVGKGLAVPAVVAALKPSPKALRAVMQMNNAVTFGGSSLGRRREELIASCVSALNECFYWTTPAAVTDGS